MKPVLFAFLLLATSALQLAFAQTKQDTDAVSKLAKGVSEHFYSGDMQRFSELWDEQATFITVGGIRADGKLSIVDMHSMGEFLIDDRTQALLKEPVVRFISTETAIAYAIWDGLAWTIRDKKLPVQSGYLTVVAQKKSGKWLIVSATNALNFDNQQPYDFQQYSPDLWKKWGITRPKGLPLGD